MFIILFILYLKSSTEQVLFNLNVCLINRLKGGPRIREASIGKWTKFHSNYGTEGCMKLEDCITSSQVHVCCSPRNSGRPVASAFSSLVNQLLARTHQITSKVYHIILVL